MRKSITLFTFFLASLSFGQEIPISESDLVGYWTLEQIVKENDINITVYRRCNISQKGTVLRFMTNGEYRITHKLGRRTCGNETRPKNVIGYFNLDPEFRKLMLDSYSNSPKTDWDVIWIDENSFGVKKPKHNNTET
ncbi:hypothetical protein [Maribacter litoralis]|uniref:Lipocalin-like domain-containing protein n=1 Tax=Maribacter litoralis TaxID=2059726 RepID=A0A653W2P5_9FLAO|nr:hypothetical protein [Maribacter litoralis]VXC12961.1 conserved hypothetical protein [Maribacter litoralis]